MKKLLKDHEKICWPPRLGSAVAIECDRRTPGDPNVYVSLVVREVLEPMPDEECVLVRCSDPGSAFRAKTMLSFGVKDIALQKPLFAFLSNLTGKTIGQVGETEADF